MATPATPIQRESTEHLASTPQFGLRPRTMFTNVYYVYKHQFCVAVVETGSKGASSKKKRLLLNLANQQNQDGAGVHYTPALPASRQQAKPGEKNVWTRSAKILGQCSNSLLALRLELQPGATIIQKFQSDPQTRRKGFEEKTYVQYIWWRPDLKQNMDLLAIGD